MSRKAKSWKIRIRHMVLSIEKIQEYTANLDDESFYKNSMIIEAVERNFQILGEASKNIPSEIFNKYPEIPWRKIKEMRNFVIHQYDDVEEHVLWDTIQKELPPLQVKLKKLLEDLDE